jgi:membrane associated rhomboid family serine protease
VRSSAPRSGLRPGQAALDLRSPELYSPAPDAAAVIPLKDDNPIRTVPFVTVSIIAVNVAVFVRGLFLPQATQQALLMRLALIPHDLTQPVAGRIDLLAYNLMTLLTSMFVHGGWLHLLGNMLYLWIFGNNIEDVLGHARYLLFYLLCGLSGAAAQIAADPASRVPMIGASGAIAGVLGAYLLLSSHVAKGVILLLWGLFLVHPIDNVLRPLLISNATHVPFIMVMFGAIGGIATWGLIGAFAGPVVLAIGLAIWREFAAEDHLRHAPKLAH